MSRSLAVVVALAFGILGPVGAVAQLVGIAGEYSENQGAVLALPQNPPPIECASDAAAWSARNFARCGRGEQHFFMTTAAPPFFRAPHHGVYGARLGTAATSTLPTVATPGPRPAGLNVGDPFRVPAGLMKQRLGPQLGLVMNNPVRNIETTYTAQAPAPSRAKNPPANTRVFRASGWVGQNDGGATPVSRGAAQQTVTHVTGAEAVTLTYTPGPNAFGGTMTTLLGGTGRFFLERSVGTAGSFPPSLNPLVLTARRDFGGALLAERDGAGWDYTIPGGQPPGYGKGYGIYSNWVRDAVIGPDCVATQPPSPAGCNEIHFWETPLPGAPPTTAHPENISVFNGAPGVFLGQIIPGATSTKHAFAWTTGWVRIRRVGVRSFLTLSDTVTGKGYDTTSTAGAVQNRNVGVVAGAYSVRNSVAGARLEVELVGLDLKLTPEPGGTIALASSLGLLCGLASRRLRGRNASASSGGSPPG